MPRLLTLHFILLLPWVLCPTQEANSQAQLTDPLNETAWELFAYRRSRPPEWLNFRVEFSDGGLRGFGGCNGFEGSYQVSGDKFEILNVEWVDRRQCEEPEGIMELEDFLFLFLQAGRRLQMEEAGEGRLLIFRPDGEALTFKPIAKDSVRMPPPGSFGSVWGSGRRLGEVTYLV